jgi:hypothetical protein
MNRLTEPDQLKILKGLMDVDDAIFVDRSREKTAEKL